ncbi:MAG: sterol desaturase family protein [Bacteroidia bacterium]
MKRYFRFLFLLKYNKWKHAGINIFTITTALVNLPLAFLLVKSSDWVVENGYGLLGWVQMPVWLQVIAGLMLLDLISAWFIHWLEHHVPWMWQFHIIHHADQRSTPPPQTATIRVKASFALSLPILAVLAVGAPTWLVFLYQTLSVIMT